MIFFLHSVKANMESIIPITKIILGNFILILTLILIMAGNQWKDALGLNSNKHSGVKDQIPVQSISKLLKISVLGWKRIKKRL